ncbi:hypothetical protein DPMN_053875 [Dreissena polymorpha]|uniref:Uncharacterized protein n=1 Tax=Dreissena polymorpha TaxID=45954 RepID=A0A9D4HQQ1_DREPO|nr:hypothetical protein DPMN_053875 [Dreissena polymorpha]
MLLSARKSAAVHSLRAMLLSARTSAAVIRYGRCYCRHAKRYDTITTGDATVGTLKRCGALLRLSKVYMCDATVGTHKRCGALLATALWCVY